VRFDKITNSKLHLSWTRSVQFEKIRDRIVVLLHIRVKRSGWNCVKKKLSLAFIGATVACRDQRKPRFVLVAKMFLRIFHSCDNALDLPLHPRSEDYSPPYLDRRLFGILMYKGRAWRGAARKTSQNWKRIPHNRNVDENFLVNCVTLHSGIVRARLSFLYLFMLALRKDTEQADCSQSGDKQRFAR